MRLSTDGLIIKETSVGESDKLVVALTRDRGIIRAFVPGARRMKNKNASSTGLLCYSNITFFKNKDTYKIDEASSIEVFFSLRSDIEKLSLAQYFCELCQRLAPEEENAETILRLVLNCLNYLTQGKRYSYQLKAIMELRLMSMSGYMPGIVACEGCAKFEGETIYFDPVTALIWCENCKPSSAYLPLERSILAAMRHIVFSDFSKLFSFSLPDDKAKKLSDITETYLLTQTDNRFLALNFFHSMGL